jgi:hypothetical protein
MLEELIIRTLCDTLPDTPLDGAYMFAQTSDNQESVLGAAHKLWGSRLIKKICCINTGPMSGYPGFAAWQENLSLKVMNERGLEAVPLIPADTPILHTGIEAQSMVSYAKVQGYESMVVIAPPFHQTRAYMAAVTAALKIYPALMLYNYPGNTQPWQQLVTHSQGNVHDSRSGLVKGEINRIYKYQETGELSTTNEILAYMNKRN